MIFVLFTELTEAFLKKTIIERNTHADCWLCIGDMPWMLDRPELFLNKFHFDYSWLAYDCMEELIFNRTMMTSSTVSEITGQSLAPSTTTTSQFNLTYYLALPFVENKTRLVVSLNESIQYHYSNLNV